MLFVLVTWKLWLCRRQILLRNLVGSSTLSFVVSCIFNLSPCAVLCLRSHKTACKHRNGLSWENPSVWRSLQAIWCKHLSWSERALPWVDLCSAPSAGWHVLGQACPCCRNVWWRELSSAGVWWQESRTHCSWSNALHATDVKLWDCFKWIVNLLAVSVLWQMTAGWGLSAAVTYPIQSWVGMYRP